MKMYDRLTRDEIVKAGVFISNKQLEKINNLHHRKLGEAGVLDEPVKPNRFVRDLNCVLFGSDVVLVAVALFLYMV